VAARLTRAESQARTRAGILDVARTLFLRDGYAATSLEQVAEAAGFTRGAVYSNFRNKDELCQAVLAGIRIERAREVVEILQASSVEERLRLFDAWAEEVVGDPGWTRLEMEFGVHARNDDALRGHLVTSIDQLTRVVAGGIAMLATLDGVDPRMRADEIAVALLSLGVGLGVFRSIHPELPIGALTNTLRVLLGLPAR
jgi:AcrR family transcriptional regulator